MGRNAGALTSAIDTAIDLIRRNGMDVTQQAVHTNLKVSPDALATAQAKGIDTAITRRLRQRGEIIVDAAPREGGRSRDGYYATGLTEHKEQLRVQTKNGLYTQNRIAAESAVIEFMEQRAKDLGYEPPWMTIAEDVDRIYAMHDAAPPGGRAEAP